MDVVTAPGCRPVGRHIHTADKCLGLPLEQVRDRILLDWNPSSSKNSSNKSHNKGYYITGRLDTTIYRDDCYFTGPDPDMPVKGLRKYLSASAQLFDTRCSFARLDSIELVERKGGTVDDDTAATTSTTIDDDDGLSETDSGVITVHWTLGGVINLPWHPTVEPWSGWTKYHVDKSTGLIYWHEEGWDVEVWRMFLGVVFPTVRWVDVIF